MNMQNPFTGLPPGDLSPSPTSILINRTRPEVSPQNIANFDPSVASNRQSVQYTSLHPSPNDIVFQTPIQNSNNYRALIFDQNPSSSLLSRQTLTTPSPIYQQHPILRQVIQVNQPLVSSSHNYNQHMTPSKIIKVGQRDSEPRVLPASQSEIPEPDEEKRFYKTLIIQYEKNIQSLKQELTIQTNIIKQLESEAVRIRGLEDAKFILENKFKDFERERLHYIDTIKRSQLERQKLEKINSDIIKNDQHVRVEIFAEIQKVRRELNESFRRQALLQQKLMDYESQMKSMAIDKATGPNVEKLKGDMEHREKQIIRLQQIITQYEADNVKHQITKNELYHKVKSLENTIQILEKQISASEEVVRKKTVEVLPIRSLQLQVESLRKTLSTTQTNLSTETQKFNLTLTAKEEELVKLRALLETQQLKFQQVSSHKNEGSRLLLKQIEDLKDTLYKRQMLIKNIQQTLITRQKQLGLVEIERNKLTNKIRLIGNQHESVHAQAMDKLRQSESKNSQLAYRIKTIESQLSKYSTQLSERSPTQQRLEQITFALEQNRKESFANKKLYEENLFNLEKVNNELEIKVRQLLLLNEQKDNEKQHFEAQNKTLYTNYIELRKQMVQRDGIEEENRLLRLKLSAIQEDMSLPRGSDAFARQSKNIDSKKSSRTNQFKRSENLAKAQHDFRGDPQSIIHSLKSQNQHLRVSLEQATSKIEEYSLATNELDMLRGKILQFQARAEKFLGSGRGHQYYTSDQEHRIMLDEVVQEMAKKLKKFKKQNKELKKQVRTRENAQEVNDHPSIQKQRRRDRQILRQDQRQNETSIKQRQKQLTHKREVEKLISDFERERQKSKDKEQQRINQIKQKMVQINKSKNLEFNQKISLLIQENQRLNKLGEQYQHRIKEYQTLFLKFKNRQNKAAEEMVGIQEQKNIEYQQQMVNNAEDFTQVEERAFFFRQKNIQLENRVEQLLAINTELKVQLEQQSEMIKVFESGNLYRHQIQILEGNVRSLQEKLDMTIEENNRLKEQDVIIHSGLPQNDISTIRINQLTSEVHTLREALEQATQRNNMNTIQRHNEHEESSSLQQRIFQLERVIQRYENEKAKLVSHNEFISQKLSNIAQPEGLLNKISLLEHQIQRLEEVNYRLNLSSGSGRAEPHQQGVVEAYHHLLNEVDKLLQRVDLVRTYTLDLVNLISQNQQSEFISELEKNLRKIADFLQDVDAIRHTISSIRRQQERQMLRGEATMYLADI